MIDSDIGTEVGAVERSLHRRLFRPAPGGGGGGPLRLQSLDRPVALLGVAVLITYSPQNGIILLVLSFLISPFGLPKAALWLLGKVQDLKYAIQDAVYG